MASHSRTSVWRKGFGTLLDKLYGKIPLVEYEQALEHLEHPYALSEILWALEWDYRDPGGVSEVFTLHPAPSFALAYSPEYHLSV